MNLTESFASKYANVQRGREDMHPFQATAVQFLKDNPFSGLFKDIGLGKTIDCLTVIADLILELEYDGPILVVGPVKVITDTWPSEIATWRHTAWINHVVIRVEDDDPRLVAVREKVRESFKDGIGFPAKYVNSMVQKAETAERHRIMAELAKSRASIHLINRERFDWLCTLFKRQWPYKVVFIDESHSFKDHNGVRFKAAQRVRQHSDIQRLHILTATPAAETYIHLFPQIFLLDLGERLGRNITAFRTAYFTYNPYKRKYTLPKALEEPVLAKIADICLVMKGQDHLPRAAPTIIQRKVKLTAAQLGLIRELEKHLIVKLPDGTKVEAKTAACLSNMLLQMASGCLYETTYIEDWDTDDLKKIKKVHNIHDNKIDTLKEIAEEAEVQGESLLVAYHYKSSLAKLQRAFPKAVTMDKAGKSIKKWNDGKIPMLFIHYQGDSDGLNLQRGGHILVLYDMHWSLEKNQQIIGRIDRQGQTKPVIVETLVAEGTRDEDCVAALMAKEDAQDRFFTILKRLIRKFRASLAQAA